MSSRTSRIAALNDVFRTTFIGGDIMMTQGIMALDDSTRMAALRRVQDFDAFTTDNDPYGEHDFGSIDLPDAKKVFWKIDYYDLNLEFGSDDPADPVRTRRVLTIMLASEY